MAPLLETKSPSQTRKSSINLTEFDLGYYGGA